MTVCYTIRLISITMQNGTNEPVQVEVKISQNGHVVSESVSGQRHQTSLKRTLIVKSGKLSARLKDPKEWRKLLSNEVGSSIQLDYVLLSFRSSKRRRFTWE
jgi:hypothetical protein